MKPGFKSVIWNIRKKYVGDGKKMEEEEKGFKQKRAF